MHAATRNSRWLITIASLALAAFMASAGISPADAAADTLTITTSGNSTGYVTSSPAGIDCGHDVPGRTDCSFDFQPGQTVTLTAHIDARFVGFSGGCTTTVLQCTLDVDGTTTVNAEFGKYEAGISATTNDTSFGFPISAVSSIQGGLWPKQGTIEFRLYGPDDATCSTNPIFTSQDTVTGTQQVYASGSYTPTQPGVYRWRAFYSGDAGNNPSSSACNSANSIATVHKATASIANGGTNATIGSPVANNATLSGQNPTGTISMSLYGPGDTTCSGTPVYVANMPVNGSGPYSSGNFTPTQTGTYRWVSQYSGDSYNSAFTSPCASTVARSIVSPKAVTLTIAATDATVGSSINGTATLAQGQSPTGSVVIKAFAPGDTACSDTPAFTSTVSVSGNGQYGGSGFVAAAAGAYRWTATYSGDSNNESAETSCGGAGGSSTVAKAIPALSAPDTAQVVIGAALPTASTLSAGYGPSGTVVFRAYGPGDSTCSGTPTHTSQPISVSGNGEYGTNDFVPVSSGSYRWIASFSGDGNNEPAATACGPASTVSQESPTLSARANSVGAGEAIGATGTIEGGHSPTGTITFTAYGPGDDDCSETPVLTYSANVTGNRPYDSAGYVADTAGSYRWIVAYSGDGNNEGATTACGDEQTVSTVLKAVPWLTLDASGDVRIDDPAWAGATVLGGFETTGTVTFKLYGPDDPECRLGPIATEVVPVSGNGRVESKRYTPARTGAYRWVAEYSGDGNNQPVPASCAEGVNFQVAPLTCPAVELSAASYKPPVIVKGRMVRGVRARISVSRPSQLAITGKLKFRLNGKQRTVALGERSLKTEGARGLRLPLPRKLQKKLPWGKKVTLVLRITATPDEPRGCVSPPTVSTRVKVRVVNVLTRPQAP